MENKDILAKAKEDLKDIEKKIWIQSYVSRKENPLIDLICSAISFLCGYLAFHEYFTKGVPFPFWVHIVALIVATVCVAIAHCILNPCFTKKGEKRCPATLSKFDPEEITDMEQLIKVTTHGYFDLGKRYVVGILSPLLSVVSWIFSFYIFSGIAKLPVPSAGAAYLILMCIITFFWSFFTSILFSQSLLLPLSSEVKLALRTYEQKLTPKKEDPHKDTPKQEPVVEPKKEETHTPLYRDLPLYQQYREEARMRYNGSSINYNRKLTDTEKQAYIDNKFMGLYSYSAMETIDKDPSLTLAQKEDLKLYLKIHGD